MNERTPDDIRPIASELTALGAHERRAAERAVERTAMRTAHLLTEPARREKGIVGRIGHIWLWLAAPGVAAAAVLLALLAMNPAVPTGPGAGGADVLAASIETDLETWAELDSMWSDDSFETSVAALSLNAAGIGSEPDSLDSLPDLDSDL